MRGFSRKTSMGLPALSKRPKGWHKIHDQVPGKAKAKRAKNKKRKKKKNRRKSRKRRGWRTGGGVVLDPDTGEVLLVLNIKERKERKTNGWTLPKGKVEGDGPDSAARHEVLEEGGVQAEPVVHLGVFGEKSRGKKVPIRRHYFLMEKERETGVHDAETAEVRWFSFEEATAILEQSRDLSALKQASRALRRLQRAARESEAQQAEGPSRSAVAQ